MFVKICSDKGSTVTDVDPICVTESQQKAIKGNSYTKYYTVLVIVVCILVLVISLADIFIGIHINTKSTKELLGYKRKFKVDEVDINEDVVSDKTDNVVVYHTNKKGEEAWFVDDLNRDITMMKFKNDDAYTCYITPLNRSQAALPTEPVKSPTQVDGHYIHEVRTYSPSGTAIRDTSILSEKARELCSGLDVFWLHKSCPGEHSNGRIKKREVRGSGCIMVCRLVYRTGPGSSEFEDCYCVYTSHFI